MIILFLYFYDIMIISMIITKLGRQFENEKKRDYFEKLRKLLNLPCDRMVNEVNLELLAIDPFHHLDGVEDLFNTQSDEEDV